MVATAAGLTACNGMTPDPKAEGVAKAAYQDLVKGDDAGLEALLMPAIRKSSDPKTFAMMRGLIPAGAAPAPTTVNWRAYAGTGGVTMTYEHAYNYGDRTVTATSVLMPARTPQGWALQTFNVNTSINGK